MESGTSWISPSVVWFFLGIIIFLVEMAAPGFILFFFGLGACLVALLLLFFDFALVWQLLIFLASSLLFIFTLRRKFTALFEGFINKKEDPSKNIDEEKGKIVKVLSSIHPPERGKVQLYGSSWLAESDVSIEAGETAEVISKNGIVLKVKPVE